jgi:hypothetical protein
MGLTRLLRDVRVTSDLPPITGHSSAARASGYGSETLAMLKKMAEKLS